jgi:hypothetical protein
MNARELFQTDEALRYAAECRRMSRLARNKMRMSASVGLFPNRIRQGLADVLQHAASQFYWDSRYGAKNLLQRVSRVG